MLAHQWRNLGTKFDRQSLKNQRKVVPKNFEKYKCKRLNNTPHFTMHVCGLYMKYISQPRLWKPRQSSVIMILLTNISSTYQHQPQLKQ